MRFLNDQQLQMQIANAEAAHRINQGKPQPWPRRNADEEHMRWQMKCLQLNQLKAQNGEAVKSTVVSRDINTCKVPFEELKPTKLSEMKLPMVHKGKYLICQVIDIPLPNIGVSTLIQDLNGDIEEMIVYNYCYNIDEVGWLKPGTILIIKEPWLRYGLSGTGVSLRIDSPSDIIFVDPTDREFLNKVEANKWYKQMSNDVEVIRGEANEYFKKGKYFDALQLYDRGIRINAELPIMYLNKSLTCLRTGAFYMAYENAKTALDKGGDHEKTLYRMGLAAYGMHEWQKAANHFIEILKEFPGHIFAGEQLKRSMARLAEQRDGKFDFKMMHFESQKTKSETDVSDYVGPIEITEIPGKGRGIVASKDIQKGTLLVVSKAFSSSHSKDFHGKLISINLIRNAEETAAQMLEVIRTIENLQKNPQRAKEVYNLYFGDSTDGEEISAGVIDAARIAQICAYNCFSSDDSVRMLNENCHLFILPSYFNHSCIANAHRNIYGDVMVIHASTNIKKGDEICLAYIHPLTHDRKKSLNCWNFTCQCSLCKADAKDEQCSKRSHIFNEFVKYSTNQNAPQTVIEKREALLKQMRKTYDNQNKFKIHLAKMLTDLSSNYFDMGNTKRCIKYLEEVINLMQDPLEYVLEDVRVNLGICYYSNGETSKAKEMMQKAFELSICNDMDHFKLIYPEVAKLI